MRAKGTAQIFRTPVELGQPLRPIGVGDRNVFLGSCFAENIGRRLADARLQTTINPMGVLYNPAIINSLLSDELDVVQHHFFQHQGMWHTWLGDSTLSRLTQDACQCAAEEALRQLRRAVGEADNLFLTFGTSHCFCLSDGGEPVANCHRMPSETFCERDLSPEHMANDLGQTLDRLHEKNPAMQVVMTVSPYRYTKFGMHRNQLDKSRLFLGIEALQKGREAWLTYFPAYEIVMDELRDYRFYAEDMLHPSQQAVDYIWQRLQDEWMTDGLRQYLCRWEPIGRALSHRPLHPESPEYEAFRQRTREQLQQLQADYPMLKIDH